MLRYAITAGRARLRPGEDEAERPAPRFSKLVRRCAELALAGVDVLLIRERELAAGELVRLSRAVADTVRDNGAATRVLVAGRADVALAAGASGVHLSGAAGELRVAQVRRVMPAAWVSVSCHALDEVRRARQDGADAVLFAPVFGKRVSSVEVVPGVGLEALRQACSVAGVMPVLALGGVTEANAGLCVEAGAAGVAGIRMFFGGAE